MREAVELAKKFVAAALRGSFKLNEYSGATNHCAYPVSYTHLAMEKYTEPVEMKMMKEIKRALDPKNILNPGKVFNA